MPPFDNVPEVMMICEYCNGLFTTKRPEFSRFCTRKCRSKASPRTQSTPASRARKAAWRRQAMDDPESRARSNEMSRIRIRQVKEWINAYKLEQGCIDCGYREHPVALDIDHMDGKTANISALKSIRAVQDEINRHKCEVRCSNCHRIKSWKTQAWLRTHPIDDSVLAETYEPVEATP